MDHRYWSLIELTVSGGLAVAFCVWQLVSTNRAIAKDRKSASPEGSRHPVREHRLDDR